MTFISTFPQSHIRNVGSDNPQDVPALRQANHIINRLVPVANYQPVVDAHVNDWMLRNIDLNELGNRLRHQVIPAYNRLMRRGRVSAQVYTLVRRQVDQALMEVIADACRRLSTRELARMVQNNDLLTTAIHDIEDAALNAYEAGGEDAIYELVLELAERAQARRNQAQ